MSHRSNREVPGPASPRARRRRKQVVAVAGVTVGGLVLATQVLPSSAAPVARSQTARTSALAAAALQPPAGKSWIEGALTDQAGHRLNNVNVEVWPTDLTAIQPVASNLTYAGDTGDPARQSGVFRLEVPSGSPYRITFSTIGGQEDGDPYRMLAYGGGGPIMTRTAHRVAAVPVVAVPGRTISLGSVSLARQGLVPSVTTAQLAKRKVRPGRHGVVRLSLSSPFVSAVAGRVQVGVAGKRVVRSVTGADQGTIAVRLPQVKKGKHAVRVRFLGSDTVAPSAAKPLRFVVAKKKR